LFSVNAGKLKILLSYWITDFLELHQELLKIGQDQSHHFKSAKFVSMNSYLLNSQQQSPGTFESRPGPTLPEDKWIFC
jgi:hypothetical protein